MKVDLAWMLIALCALCKTADGANDKALVVGTTLPLSGVSGEVGKEWLRGANSCAQQINADGGVTGRFIRIVSKDDGGDAQRAVENARTLTNDDQSVVLVGGMGTSILSELLAWAASQNLLVLGPDSGLLSAQAPKYDTTYFLTANSAIEAERLVGHMSALGTKRVLLLYSKDPEGQYALTAFEQALTVHGIIPARSEPLSSSLTAHKLEEHLRLSDAQAVVLATSPQNSAVALRTLSAIEGGGRVTLQVYALSGSVAEPQFRQIGESVRSLVLSQVTPRPDDPSRRVSAFFLRALRASSDKEPTYTSFRGCIAVTVLATVMKQSIHQPNKQGILAAFKTANQVDLGGWSVDLSDRQVPGSRFVDITLFSSGRRPVR